MSRERDRKLGDKSNGDARSEPNRKAKGNRECKPASPLLSGRAAPPRLPLDEPPRWPSFARERAAMRRGVTPVAGCDEAGRGPLAGPVVAAAVILDPKRIPRGLNDSKKLDAAERERLYEKICATAEVGIAFGSRSRIDRDNIRQASLWALARAVAALPVRPRLVLVDGIDRIDVRCDCEAIVSGDALVLSIAAASIVAKVVRDRLMVQVGAAHPGYGFERHMGYSVPEHFRALAQLGPTVHHRRSFAPVAAAHGDDSAVQAPSRGQRDLRFPESLGVESRIGGSESDLLD
jgi:ribonuclease HII